MNDANATDTISRQAAIETVMECYDNDELFEVYEDKLRELPPAFATDINVGDKDTISRKAAIDAVNCVMIMKGIRSGKSVASEAVESAKSIIADNIRQLPPAQPEPLQPWEVLAAQAVLSQPEIIRCKDCKHWIPYDWMFSEVWQSRNINDYPEDEIGCNYCDMAMKANDFCSRGERREVTE